MQYVVKKSPLYSNRGRDQEKMQINREAYITKVKLFGLVKQRPPSTDPEQIFPFSLFSVM